MTIAGVSFDFSQLIMAAIVIASAVAFWTGFRYTRVGLAIRASAENEGAAVLLGYSPGPPCRCELGR